MTDMVPVKGFPGYFITRCGEVFSNRGRGRGNKDTARIRQLKTHPNTHGYLDIVFSINGRRKHMAVHRLVAETFLEKTAKCVNHLDGNQKNNCVENLEWCSDVENKAHAKAKGLMKSGDDHWKVKLTSEKLVLVEKLRSQGMSGRKIAKLLGLAPTSVNSRLAKIRSGG